MFWLTRIDIYSGFLGAGKTTLIKKMIAEGYGPQNLVLIENEFGEIGIDGGFLQEAGIEIREMNSGCICCSLVGDFGKALEQVLDQYHPDRVIIEPSGVGKLSDVIAAVRKLTNPDVELGYTVAVADAGKCKVYMKNFGEFYNNQIETASTIVLSRTDAIPQEKLDAAVSLLRKHNAVATLVTTPWDQLTGAQLVEAMEHKQTLADDLAELQRQGQEASHCKHHHDEEHEHHAGCCRHQGEEHEHHAACCHHHGEGHPHNHGEAQAHHHADEIFTSWGVETPKKFTAVEIRRALEELEDGRAGTVLRAKGIVPAPDGTWIYFDYVPGEHNIRSGSAAVTGRLCVIGAELNQSAIAALFGV